MQIFWVVIAILWRFLPFCLFFRYIIWNSRWYYTRGFNWWIILDISLQFLAVYLVFFWLFFCIFCHFRGYSRQFFAYSIQFRGQLHWIHNHIPSSLVFMKYSKWQYRHIACLYIYIFIFNPHFACSSWRDHDNDQGDQNWSWSCSRMLSFWESCCIRY